MIQEKDFLYRVPVKTAPITTPGGQIRNPEILVDVEGGEFMHGNILDANSTSKLVNQSVKEAVDNKLIESGYVTKDLLEAETTRATEQENSLKTLIGAETSARTKGDEDLSSKIKAEQTRAEGKEKEISDKLAIVNGDSNTEGSFRKAIADVVAAAPEDLDTLKEIADKLAGNDDLHTALNQAITEKADASALLNEVTRATGAESGLQAAIATKADAAALSNYVLTTALNQQVDTLNAAISAKQDAGKYISYNKADDFFYYLYNIGIISQSEDGSAKVVLHPNYFEKADEENTVTIRDGYINISNSAGNIMTLNNDDEDGGIVIYKQLTNSIKKSLRILEDGIRLMDGDNNHVLTSNASTIDITQYAKKTELPVVPTKTSQLTNDSNFITADVVDPDSYTFNNRDLKIGSEDIGYVTIGRDGVAFGEDEGFEIDDHGFHGHSIDANYSFGRDGINMTDGGLDLTINQNAISCADGRMNLFLIDYENITLGDTIAPNVKVSREGIYFAHKTDKDIPTAGGSFISLSSLASAEDISSLRAGLSKKQDKITVNEVDVTDIETADITKLRTIVTNLINALSSSGLINTTDGVE